MPQHGSCSIFRRLSSFGVRCVYHSATRIHFVTYTYGGSMPFPVRPSGKLGMLLRDEFLTQLRYYK
jgi:hypothetical protein